MRWTPPRSAAAAAAVALIIAACSTDVVPTGVSQRLDRVARFAFALFNPQVVYSTGPEQANPDLAACLGSRHNSQGVAQRFITARDTAINAVRIFTCSDPNDPHNTATSF